MALLNGKNNRRGRSRYVYLPTALTDTFTGPDSRGFTLSYTPGEAFVALNINGVEIPAGEYEAFTGSSVKLLNSIVPPGAKVEIIAESTTPIANSYSQDQTHALLGDCGAELYRVDGTNVGVRAVNGGRLRIGGISRPVTNATLNKSGIANTSLITYVYAYWTGSAMAYEFSTAAPTLWTDGTMIKTNDASRSIVGMCFVMGDTVQFHDEVTRRTVLTWHNRKPKLISQSVNAAATSQAGALANLGALSYFLAWRDTAIEIRQTGYITTNALDHVFTGPRLNAVDGSQIGARCAFGEFQASGGSYTAANTGDALHNFCCGMRTTGSATATTTSVAAGTIWG
jgi:hypothetical protein